MEKLTLILIFVAAGILHCNMAFPSDHSSSAMFKEDKDSQQNPLSAFNGNGEDEAGMEQQPLEDCLVCTHVSC